MALDDITYQNVEIVEIPDSLVNTISDISYPKYEVCELILKASVIGSSETITIYQS
jgi:hypothetical protein